MLLSGAGEQLAGERVCPAPGAGKELPEAESGSEQSAQRIPGTLLAAMEIPIPVVHTTIPKSHSPLATASAAFMANSG